jgi:hypothetical protein
VETIGISGVKADCVKECQHIVAQKATVAVSDPLECSQVACREVGVNLRRIEVDNSLRSEGTRGEGPFVKELDPTLAVPHAPGLPVLEEQRLGGHHAPCKCPTEAELVVPALGLGLFVGPSVNPKSTSHVSSVSKAKGGVQNHVSRPANQHIRFFSEDEVSNFSDSIEDLVRDEQRLLKLRQRNRKKKKSISLSKKHSGPVLEEVFDASPKSGKGDKKCYQVCSTHRRTVSLPVRREEEWSEEEVFVSGRERCVGEHVYLKGRVWVSCFLIRW